MSELARHMTGKRQAALGKKPRQANLEILRIVSMMMIICIHILVHGDVLDAVTAHSGQQLVVGAIHSLCLISVNCYVLISGYFLITSKFRIKKLLIMIGEVFFYSVLFFIIFSATSGNELKMNFKSYLTVFLPTFMREYWFVTNYVALYIFAPFLNKGINALSKRQHLAMLAVLFFLLVIWRNVFFLGDAVYTGGGNSFAWFCYLYAVAAYFRLHYVPSFKPLKCFLIFLGVTVITPLCDLILYLLPADAINGFCGKDFMKSARSMLFHYDSIIVFLSSVALLVFFINVRVKNQRINRLVLFFSPCTFGVYLIHDNPFVRKWLWNLIDPTQYLYSYPVMFLSFICIVLVVFTVCALLEKVRATAFKPINNSKWLDSICKKLSAFPEKIQKHFGVH